MNRQLANFSTDLRRVSYWIYGGRKLLADKFLSMARSKYKINGFIGPYQNIWAELEKIKKMDGGRIAAADRASTMSSILLQESFKT